MAELIEEGPTTAPPTGSTEISAPSMQTQYNSPSLSRKPLLSLIVHPNSAPQPRFRTPNFISPLGSPLRRVIKLTRLDPHDAWLPITESRNGNAFYAAFHTLCAGIGIQALVLPVGFTILGWSWGIISLTVAFAWQLYTFWVLTNLHESAENRIRYSRFIQLFNATFVCSLPQERKPSASAENLKFPMYECDTSAPDPAVNRPIPPLPPVPYSLDDWKGELFSKAMDRIDHSYLCLILRHRKPEDIQLIFSELKDQICLLMFNRFGTSVILDLCEVCDEQQMNQLVSSLTADAYLLMLVCLNSNGCRAVLVLLACLRTPKQKSDVIYALQPLVAQLVNHQFGSDVIGGILRIFRKTAKETQPILDAIADFFYEMATNLHGSRLLRELLDSKVFLLESRQSIMLKLIAYAHPLSYHPYGCLVLEGVIKIGFQDVQRHIAARLRGDFALMSMHKDARIVVLALIMESKEELAPQIYNEMASSLYFSRVLQDPFGKRVIERAWTCTKKTSHEILPFPDLHEENVWPKKKKSRIHD